MSRIAFIGLGNMGGPMAANLVKAGHTVRGFDPVPEAVKTAQDNGIETFPAAIEAVSAAEGHDPHGRVGHSRPRSRCSTRTARSSPLRSRSASASAIAGPPSPAATISRTRSPTVRWCST